MNFREYANENSRTGKDLRGKTKEYAGTVRPRHDRLKISACFYIVLQHLCSFNGLLMCIKSTRGASSYLNKQSGRDTARNVVLLARIRRYDIVDFIM
jgi:hypothetical protein